MSRISRQKEKYGRGSELFFNNYTEGTAARTRPLSYDEIMVNRKNKELSRDVKEGAGEAEKKLRKYVVEDGSDHFESTRGYKHSKDSLSSVIKHASEEDILKEKPSMKEDDLNKGKYKAGHESDPKLKGKLDSDMSSNKIRGGRSDNRGHGRRKDDERLSDDSASDSEKKHSKDFFGKVTDMSNKSKGGRSDKRGHIRRKDDAHLSDDSESDSKKKYSKNSLGKETDMSNKSKGGRSYKRGHGRRKDDERLSDDSESDSERKHSKNFLGKETDMSNKSKGGRSDKRGYGRRKDDERLSDDSKSDSEKKHSKNSLGKETYTERSREKSEKESKRKYRCGDDEKIKSRNAVKKHDSGKRHDLEFSDRRERRESPQSRYEESRLKRRRSRSREREKDRKSISPLPKTHNHTSYLVREHGELPSHSLKDRSGRQHSDVDRSGRQHSDVDKNKIADNGLSIRRHGGFASGLGGYSPRKRRTEAGVRTPSPPSRSPEKKSIGWDLPPAKTDCLFSGSVLTNSQSSNQHVLSNVHELVSPVPVASSTGNPLSGAPLKSLSTNINNASLDSIQLTQATRTKRRLYVENVPASASEKAIMECLNSFLLSSGVNYIQGTLPCISCIIHKEKGQALVEFITPEDASAALSLDGCCLSGSILKIRRPKDFVDVATGAPEKSVAAVGAISDIVKDSPHKIFIGGISKSLSSEMFIEIASAFGPLKAYRFHVFEDLNEPCAFLEYVDQSVTLKACSGLNGMKLGGQILTAVQAVPNASSLENTGNLPFYGIPEHAKPLLETPTQVLKLKNVFNPEGFLSLSEVEVEEVLEDIRLECARFGNVKAVKVVKYENSCTTNPESDKATDDMGSSVAPHDAKCKENNETVEVTDHDTFSRVDGEITEENSSNDEQPAAGDPTKDEFCELNQIDSNTAVENPIAQNNSDAITQELPNQPESPKVESKVNEDNMGEQELNSITLDNMGEQELNSEEDKEVKLQEIESHAAIENEDARVCDLEPSCVVVEYRRMEASCAAAHCLHGRLFDDRIVSVEYVDLDLYRARFPK